MLDYTMIKLLFTVFSLLPTEIAKIMGEKIRVVETAVFTDLKLTELDRHKYDNLSLQEKLKILDLERMKAFQVKYAQIESAILDRMILILRTEPDENLGTAPLNRMASTLNMLRQPVYKDYDTDNVNSTLTSAECSSRAAEASARLEELRKRRTL